MTDRPGLPAHAAAAGLLITDRRGRVLMVANPYRDRLVLPGGMIEVGESPAAAAEREVLEETGLRVTATRLLVVQHAPARPPKPASLQFVFDTNPVDLDPPLTPQPDEVSDLLWLDPATAVHRHAPAGQARLAAAFRARAGWPTVYLDDTRQLPT